MSVLSSINKNIKARLSDLGIGEVADPTADDLLVADLRAALAEDRVRMDSGSRSLHSKDASVFKGCVAGPTCFPLNTGEVQAIMRISSEHGRAIVPRGAGTGLAGCKCRVNSGR